LVSAAGDLEVILTDTTLSEGSGGEKVNSLRLVSIILVVSHRLTVLIRDISSDGRASEGFAFVIRVSNGVGAVRADRNTEIFVGL